MASLQIYDPFTDTAVETLFRNFLRTDRGDRAAPQGIRVDVAENDKGYAVYAEIPGVKKDEIHVAIEGNQVTIAAEVKPPVAPAEGTRVLRAERYNGNVYRSFTLPVELDGQREAAVDVAVVALGTQHARAFRGCYERLHFGGHRHLVAFDGDVNLVLLDTGNFGVDDVTLVVLGDVDANALRRCTVAAVGAKEITEQRFDGGIGEWIVDLQTGHGSFPFVIERMIGRAVPLRGTLPPVHHQSRVDASRFKGREHLSSTRCTEPTTGR